MIRIGFLIVLIGVSVGGTIARATSLIHQRFGQKVLVVGDSHLGGPYGKKLYQLLTGEGRREISLYSACGSTARDWSIATPPQKHAPCGLSVARPHSDFNNPLAIVEPRVLRTKATKTHNGKSVTRPQKKVIQPLIPFLRELLEGKDFTPDPLAQKPDVLIVSLGTNMIGLVPENQSFETFYRSKVWAARKNYPGLFSEIDQIFGIQSATAPAARCVWVGPPACDHMADGSPCFPRVEILNRTLARVLKGRCDYIDALKMTYYPSNLDSDGYHFSGNTPVAMTILTQIAEKWATDVFQKLSDLKVIQ